MAFSVHTVNTLSDNFSYILVCNETKVRGERLFSTFPNLLTLPRSTRPLWTRWSR